MGTSAVQTADAPLTVVHLRPDDPDAAREFDAFIALLPELRRTHPGEYVAVCGGRVVASGPDLDPVIKSARGAGAEPFYCGWVEPAGGCVVRFPSPLRVSETPG